MDGKGLLIVISGPSGAGKGTICKELLSRHIENIELSISATTRLPRNGEVEGISYFFKSKDDFLYMIQNNDLIEYAHVYGNYYGTPKKYVLDKIDEGKDVILEIDVQGAMKVKQNYPDAVFIFIMPPSYEELKHRILSRGTETLADIEKRMHSAYEEIKSAANYGYIVINDDVKKATDKVCGILLAEKCKCSRNKIDFDSYKEV